MLRHNLFGLEIDPRCVQIAAFSLALAAWKAGGYRDIPIPSVACSGIPVSGQLESWLKIAGDDANMRQTLGRLHGLFVNAPDLGSLVDPMNVPVRERMFTPDFGKIAPLLEDALAKETDDDPVAAVFGSAALGVARAAELLARQYTLVATNVPYLVRNKQGAVVKDFLTDLYASSKANLATAFIERCRTLVESGCSYALVAPQNWLFLGRYEKLRRQLLHEQIWHMIVSLGPNAFETISGEVVNVALQIMTNSRPGVDQLVVAQEVDEDSGAELKSKALRSAEVEVTRQRRQIKHPDARFVFGTLGGGSPLHYWAKSPRGIVSGDAGFWIRRFWELPKLTAPWRPLQSTVNETQAYGGREHIIHWGTGGSGMLRPGLGNPAYGHHGVAIGLLGGLNATLYSGELYDNNTGVIVPNDESLVPAIWAYCSSNRFRESVRKIDRKMNVTNATLLKVPFDASYWRGIADGKGPLPQLRSDDCTQWLFDGNPADGVSISRSRRLGFLDTRGRNKCSTACLY